MYVSFDEIIVPPVIYPNFLNAGENELVVYNGFVRKGENSLIRKFLEDKSFDIEKIINGSFKETYEDIEPIIEIPEYDAIKIIGSNTSIEESQLMQINALYRKFFHRLIDRGCRIIVIPKNCRYHYTVETYEDIMDELEQSIFHITIRNSIYIIQCFSERTYKSIAIRREILKKDIIRILKQRELCKY
jgi:hypothetical protein